MDIPETNPLLNILTYDVYVKLNDKNSVIAVNSSDFLKDTTDWIKIDTGSGDKYHHAQGNYFDKSLVTELGQFRYIMENDVVREKTEEELAQELLPDADIVKASKIQEIKASCEQAIHAGFDADVLSRGTLHYTLTDYQQRDMDKLKESIDKGATEVLWHDTSRVTHEVYTAEQFTTLYQAGYTHIITCKIRSDFLEQYVNDLITSNDITTTNTIDWNTTLPDEYQTQVDAQIFMMLTGITTTTE